MRLLQTWAGSKRRGVTLIELLIVISLVSVLLGISLGVFANMNIEERTARGSIANVLRSAVTSAMARNAPARVVLDREGRTIRAESMKVVGTWHFEGETLEGAFGLNGRLEKAALIEDGYLGNAISFSGTSRPTFAEIPVQTDPAFEFRDGFQLDFCLRIEEGGTGKLIDCGGVFGVEWNGDALIGWLMPAILDKSDDSGRLVRGTRILLESQPGQILMGDWVRVSLNYDRRRFRMKINDVAVSELVMGEFVWDLSGPLMVGDTRRSFPGSLDKLVISGVVASEVLNLPAGVELTPETTNQVVIEAGGQLDRSVHKQPVGIGLLYEDGGSERIQVGLYGTVE